MRKSVHVALPDRGLMFHALGEGATCCSDVLRSSLPCDAPDRPFPSDGRPPEGAQQARGPGSLRGPRSPAVAAVWLGIRPLRVPWFWGRSRAYSKAQLRYTLRSTPRRGHCTSRLGRRFSGRTARRPRRRSCTRRRLRLRSRRTPRTARTRPLRSVLVQVGIGRNYDSGL